MPGRSCWRPPYRLLAIVHAIHEDGLHRAGGHRAQDLLALGVVGLGIVHERFLTDQLERARRQEAALSVALTAVQIDHDAHDLAPSRGRYRRPRTPQGSSRFASAWARSRNGCACSDWYRI